jgi:hypothetical protein
MPYEYLSNLKLDPDTRNKLRALGALTPSALLSMMDRAPEKFANYIGEESITPVRQGLEQQIAKSSGSDESKSKPLPPFTGATGGRLPPRFRPARAKIAIQKRDELMDEISNLRNSGNDSDETKQTLEDLETQLKATLSDTVAQH